MCSIRELFMGAEFEEFAEAKPPQPRQNGSADFCRLVSLARYAAPMTLHVIVLGSAAGGGFPQWNCGCDNCLRVRRGEPGFEARTQDSVAVSGDGENWFLLNASPDVLVQAQRTPELWPSGLRDAPISGVVLTNGDLDHCLGLFLLRESQPLAVYATRRVEEGLRRNAALRTLERFEGHSQWHQLALGREVELLLPSGQRSGVFVLPIAAKGKPPLHLMGLVEPHEEDNVLLRIRAGERSLVYASAIADASPHVEEFAACDALLLDGTFWSEEELPGLGLTLGVAKTMAHQPMSGEDGTLRALADVRGPRRVYTHVNNTNPVLNPASAELTTLEAQGWEVARDGLRFTLD